MLHGVFLEYQIDKQGRNFRIFNDKLIFPLCMHLVGRHLVRFWRMFGRFGYCDVDFEIILVMGLTNDIHLDVQL